MGKSCRGLNTHQGIQSQFVAGLRFHDFRWPCARASIMNGLPKLGFKSERHYSKELLPTLEISCPSLAKRRYPGGTAFFCRSLKGNNLRVLETVKSCSALSVSQRRGSKVNLNSLANCLTEIQCALLASWITLQASWEAAAAGASCVRAGPCSIRRTRVQEDPADVPARSPPTGTPHSACSALPPCLRERLQLPAAGWRAPVRKSQPF